ncbi:unnamed protein product [Mesocestoides corti]|uniref:Uncharacterized protein n=1 Tax=Mesocestoides corti TaxID=53468 RepID=A0A0R3U8X8_MESCO|nr:unnamed protein product [Mesocestoides corti]
MSSLLLLSAIVEGVASFVLPIINAFGTPRHVEHKFYFEVFKITQFTLSIMALAYLQMLVNLYTRKLHKHKRNYVECTDDEGRDDNYNQDANFVEADDFPKSLRKSKENGIKFIEEGNFSSPSTLSDEQNQRDEVHEEAEELAELEQISLPDSLSTNHISGPRPRLVVIKVISFCCLFNAVRHCQSQIPLLRFVNPEF